MIKKAYNETECICRIKSLERDLSSALANADHWMSRKEESDRENARLNCLVDDCDSLQKESDSRMDIIMNLREAMAEIREVWVGSDDGIVETSQAAYFQRLVVECYQIAGDALK